jgi:uncharacterized membrane protein YdjX (TVP38/TMEM64 family)
MAQISSPSLTQRLRPLAITGLAGALPVVGVVVLASNGQAIIDTLSQWSTAQQALLIIGTGALICGAALLPTHALSLAAGWLLGGVWGPIAAWAGVVVGAMLGYLVGRALAGPGLVRWIQGHDRWRVVHEALFESAATRTASLIALLRLSPVAPFAATNVALAALRPRLGAFVIGSALGLAPRVAVVAYLGAGMAQIDFDRPQSPWLIGAGVLATLVLLIAMGWLAKRALQRVVPVPAGAGQPID